MMELNGQELDERRRGLEGKVGLTKGDSKIKVRTPYGRIRIRRGRFMSFSDWLRDAPWQGIALVGAGTAAIVTVVVIVIVRIAGV